MSEFSNVAYACKRHFEKISFKVSCLPFDVAQKCQQQENAHFIVLFVLILCHVKEAYLPHKKQESAFLMWHRNIKSKKMPL